MSTRIRYDVYAGDMLLGRTYDYAEAVRWRELDRHLSLNGPYAEIREVTEKTGREPQ
jgi:hypothetical protein